MFPEAAPVIKREHCATPDLWTASMDITAVSLPVLSSGIKRERSASPSLPFDGRPNFSHVAVHTTAREGRRAHKRVKAEGEDHVPLPRAIHRATPRVRVAVAGRDPTRSRANVLNPYPIHSAQTARFSLILPLHRLDLCSQAPTAIPWTHSGVHWNDIHARTQLRKVRQFSSFACTLITRSLIFRPTSPLPTSQRVSRPVPPLTLRLPYFAFESLGLARDGVYSWLTTRTRTTISPSFRRRACIACGNLSVEVKSMVLFLCVKLVFMNACTSTISHVQISAIICPCILNLVLGSTELS